MLNMAVCILHSANIVGEGIHATVLSTAINK